MSVPRILLALSLLLIAGCVSPVTPQTMPWSQPDHQFSIKTVSPGYYQMDQFVVTYQGLDTMFKQEISKGHQPDVVIHKGLIINDSEEQIRIAKLAEQHGLSVYQRSIMGTTKTTSEAMELAVQEEMETETEESN